MTHHHPCPTMTHPSQPSQAYFRLGKAVVQLWQARHNLEADGVRGAMVALGALQVALQPLMRGQTTPARVMQPLEPSTSAAMSQLAECGLRALLPEMLNEMAEQIEEAPAIDPVWLLILQPWDPDRGAMQHLAGTASLMVQHVVTCLCARVWASADTTDLCIAGARLVIAGTQWCSQQLHDGERPSCYSAVADVALRMFAEVVRARHIGEQVDSTTPWGSPSEQGPV